MQAEILASYKPTVNMTLLIPNLRQVEDLVNKSLEYFKSTRHIILYYEDIIKNRTVGHLSNFSLPRKFAFYCPSSCSRYFFQKLVDVQNFLRVPQQELNSRQVKIHKGSLSSQVENWGDIEKTLKGTHYESFLNEDYKL